MPMRPEFDGTIVVPNHPADPSVISPNLTARHFQLDWLARISDTVSPE